MRRFDQSSPKVSDHYLRLNSSQEKLLKCSPQNVEPKNGHTEKIDVANGQKLIGWTNIISNYTSASLLKWNEAFDLS